MKIVKISDNAYFVASYSDQTIQRAYSTETTVQSFGDGAEAAAETKKQPEHSNEPKSV